MKLASIFSMAVVAAAMTLPTVASAATVQLVNWNFNNSLAGSGGAPGPFNSTGTAEVYNAANMHIEIAGGGVAAATAYVDCSNVGPMGGASANNNWGNFQGVLPGTTTTSGGSLSVVGSGNNQHSVTFYLSATGYNLSSLTYDTRGTATGFATQTWSYSTNNVDFTTLSTISGRNVTTWSSQSVALSSIPTTSNLYLRVTVDGASSTSGNNRIDNVVVNADSASAVPLPTAAIAGFAGLGMLGAVKGLRRRK